MEQVEPDRCDYLFGNQDGSERMRSINEQERNRSGNITMIGSEVVGQKWPNGAGDGDTSPVPIHSRDGGQVEPEPCVTLSGKLDGSDHISSKIQTEGNVYVFRNITTICDQVVAPPWPKGYGPSFCICSVLN